MNSFIFIAKSQEIITNHLDTFYKEHNIGSFDRSTIAEEGTIGIEAIRNMQESLFLKPYKGEKKSIVIQNAHLLTIEAQNALLKVLEEPPHFVYFVLIAPTPQNFLPTILSRCQVIIGEKEIVTFSQEDEEKLLAHLATLENQPSLSDLLSLAENISGEKENLQQWFEAMLHMLRNRMLKEVAQKENTALTVKLLMELQKAYETYINTNVNPRILLEHTFLSL